MPKNDFFNTTAINAFIDENNLPPTCHTDISLGLGDLLDEKKLVQNQTLLGQWLADRPHLMDKDKHRQPIDEAMEAAAFGPGCTLAARGRLQLKYGELMFAERRDEWKCDHSLKPGTMPGKLPADIVKQAEKIVAGDAALNASPFNPAVRFRTPADRVNAISQYIRDHSTKDAQKAAAHFRVDLAGRAT